MFEQWAELDLNPFLSFNEHGKIQYTNQEAQYLLNKVTSKTLYDLALQYAPKSFGFNTTYVNIDLGSYLLYAITVGYEDESSIAIKLYKSTQPKKETKINNNAQITNLFTIVDLAISTNKMRCSADFEKSYDPSIPDFKIVVNDLLKMLNQIYEHFKESKQINTQVRFKIGEYIKVDNKKLSLVSVNIYTSDTNKNFGDTSQLEQYANKFGLLLETKPHQIQINLPLILK